MPRLAAIDLGSNASRLLVVEARSATEVVPIHQLRIPVRLGHGVFVTGRLDDAAIDQASAALATFARVMEQHEVQAYRAVVTASARDAENASDLIAGADAAGVHLEAIDGTEEARLVKLAVERTVALADKRALLVDLGGGSLELSEVHHDQVRFSASLPIGTVRLLESFLSAGKAVTKGQEHLLVEYLDRVLAPVHDDFFKKSYDLVAGTGGNFDAIAALCPVSGATTPTIDVRKARALLPKMALSTPAQRRKRWSLKPDRADVIVPALYVLRSVADLARTDAVVAPGVGLKEGLAYELVDKHFRVWDYRLDENQGVRAAVQLGRRYHFDEPHATQVDRLAAQLFDLLAPLHRLDAHDRLLLRVAAVVHDVGDFVHYAAHHKHSQYIVEHSDVMGLSPEERRLVGCVARYHRRAPPSTKHAAFRRLSTEERRRVRKLAAILRVADGLDRGHRSKVHTLDVAIGRQEVVVRVGGREDLSLELWTTQRKAALFDATFRRRLRVASDA